MTTRIELLGQMAVVPEAGCMLPSGRAELLLAFVAAEHHRIAGQDELASGAVSTRRPLATGLRPCAGPGWP